MGEAIFIPGDEPGWFDASELARGPWDEGAQHGGAPAALLVGALEALPGGDELQFARITLDFLRPVPLGPVQVRSSVVRPGRRVRLLQASLHASDGTDLVRALALQLLRADGPPTPPVAPPPSPSTGRANDLRPHFDPMFAPDAMEIRFVAGEFTGRGPATAWFRFRVPVLAGAPVSPLQRLAGAGDFGNGISSPVSWDDYVFINPDLTLYVEREPQGEWIALQSTTHIADGGIGLSESVLYDERGRVGRAVQSLLVAPRTATSGGRP